MGFMVVDLMGSCLMISFHRVVLELGFSVRWKVDVIFDLQSDLP